MGGSSNPIKAIADTAVDLVSDAGSTVQDVAGDVITTAEQTVDDASSEVARWDRAGIFLDPNAEATQDAKDADKQAAKDAAAAQVRQADAKDAALKTRAANRDASAGSSIILGGKKKGKKGSSVSKGMGLSTGDTGLQV